MARRVHIVPHTHWDREWYRPFQAFRMRLVDLIDDLLPQLEGDPSYTHFMLDGQMAVVDDYLAIRPEHEDRLRALAASGRLSVGPWYVLVDEFLVSGETLIRDLELGLDTAARFGGAMEVGYLPDMFGHVSQMPQLLRQFGFAHAVVWRGVPSEIGADAFWWEAPDGSTVRATYLSRGYSNGAVVPDDAKELIARIEEFVIDEGPRAGDPVLWMNGTDHLLPQPWLGRVVEEANRVQDGYQLTIGSLVAYTETAPTNSLPRWSGELRSGARANLLMGVASNRVDVHQAEARVTRALERVAEPLSALYRTPSEWPAPFLAEAWREVIRNAAHDSICACSIDEVGLAVLHRFGEAEAIADGLTRRAVAAMARRWSHGRPLAINPSARERTGVVELELDPGDDHEGDQVLSRTPARVPWITTTRAGLEDLLVRELDINPSVHRVTFSEDDSVVTLWADRASPVPTRTHDVRRYARAWADGGASDAEVVIELARRPTVRVLRRVDAVPGFGWRAVDGRTRSAASVEPVVVGPDRRSLSNGVLTVSVDDVAGTFALNGHAGLGRLVEDGDAGDTYNYNPPGRDRIVDRPEEAVVAVIEDGPVRARLRLQAIYHWPIAIVEDERRSERSVPVATTLELRAGEDLVRVTVEFDNVCRDHRLRAWFPLAEPAAASHAECAFTVVERGLTAEGGATEVGLPTFPSRRFVSAGGLTVTHEGLLEYELVDVRPPGEATAPDREPRAHALALTLLRATGIISQGPMTNRPVPAGPPIAAPGAQMPGRQRLRYALHVGDRDPYAVADDAFLPLLVGRPAGGPAVPGAPAAGAGAQAQPDHGSALSITGAEVSSVRRHNGRLEVRVFNPTASRATVVLDGRRGHLVDLRGRTMEAFENRFPLEPHAIATVALDE